MLSGGTLQNQDITNQRDLQSTTKLSTQLPMCKCWYKLNAELRYQTICVSALSCYTTPAFPYKNPVRFHRLNPLFSLYFLWFSQGLVSPLCEICFTIVTVNSGIASLKVGGMRGAFNGAMFFNLAERLKDEEKNRRWGQKLVWVNSFWQRCCLRTRGSPGVNALRKADPPRYKPGWSYCVNVIGPGVVAKDCITTIRSSWSHLCPKYQGITRGGPIASTW